MNALFLETRAVHEISQNRFKICIYEALVSTAGQSTKQFSARSSDIKSKCKKKRFFEEKEKTAKQQFLIAKKLVFAV